VADAENPLTARVMVNRVWGYHFGRSIVNTPNDFGRMGARPSNPELLDWLANRFVEGGWKLKPIHRMILLSSAYRQTSASPIEKIAMEKDADDALLWKFDHRRLEAEEIRDSMLAIAGRLNTKIGGPSFMVPIDPELVLMLKRPQYWVPTKDKTQYDRRTLYMIYKRNLRLPFVNVFDAPDTLLSCARRDQSTHAPQALELLNGKTSNDLAAVLAGRLLKERKTAQERIDYAWRLAAVVAVATLTVTTACAPISDNHRGRSRRVHEGPAGHAVSGHPHIRHRPSPSTRRGTWATTRPAARGSRRQSPTPSRPR